VAKALESNAMYVDHGAYTANYFKSISIAATNKLFFQDHTHTSPAGVDVVAKAFVKGLQCGRGDFLKDFVKNATATTPRTCLCVHCDRKRSSLVNI
ncbi:carbohydrate esterase family 12 protein, partial [Macroventuria anomochaeta]